jgi:ABC-type sugar transport system ATPase subunit
MNDRTPLLEVDEVTKSFGQVSVLRGVSLTVAPGQVTALVGGNGAGKSTLIKTIVGVHPPDSGSMRFKGVSYRQRTPNHARRLGIETVFQDLALVDQLKVWQNLFLGRELTHRLGPLRLLDRRGMALRAREMLRELEINVPSVQRRVRRLSGGQRQGVAICRATGFGSQLIVMDEPTAALGVQETGKVEELIVRLREQGQAILLISHDFAQVLRVADFVWVMYLGRIAGGRRTAETTGQELVELMTGTRQPALSERPTHGLVP